MHSNKTSLKKQAKKSVGRPVCIVLNDGSYYIGTISEVNDNEITFSPFDGRKNMKANKRRNTERAQVSGILGSLFGGGGGGGGLNPSSLFGGGGAGGGGFNPLSMLGGLGGGAFGGGPGALAGAESFGGSTGIATNSGGLLGSGGILGFMGKIWPIMKMGFGLLKTIIPIVGGFFNKKK